MRAQILLQVVGLFGGLSFIYVQGTTVPILASVGVSKQLDISNDSLKSQLIRLERHLDFLSGLFAGNIQDIADWCLSSGRNITHIAGIGRQLVAQKDSVKKDIKNQLKKFPVYEISEKIQSQELREILIVVHTAGDFSGILGYWQKLCSLADNSNDANSFCVLQGVRDLSCITHLLYTYLAGICSNQCAGTQRDSFWLNFIPSQNNTLMNLLYVYATIDKLPLEDMISSIDRFVDEFTQALAKLEASPDSSSDGGEDVDNPLIGGAGDAGQDSNFIGWLKEKWVILPLSVGVIIIKTIYYFWAKEKDKDKEKEGFFSLISSLR